MYGGCSMTQHMCLMPLHPKNTIANCLSCLIRGKFFKFTHHIAETRMKCAYMVISNNFNNVNVAFFNKRFF